MSSKKSKKVDAGQTIETTPENTPEVTETTKKEKDPQKQMLSGRGLSRVQIASTVVERLRAELAAAEIRLAKAVAQEYAKPKTATKEFRAKVAAIKNLRKAGLFDDASNLMDRYGIGEDDLK